MSDDIESQLANLTIQLPVTEKKKKMIIYIYVKNVNGMSFP